MTRDAVLGAVRRALGGGGMGPPELAPWRFPAVGETDLVARFVAEAALVDTHVVEAQKGRWWEVLEPYLHDHEAVFPDPGVEASRIGLRLTDGVEAAARPDVVAGIAVGIHGIAESGSVVVDADGAHLPSLLTELSVLLLPKDRIVPGLEMLPAPGPAVRNRVLVTGPSRTADIEKRLVLGAHGPRRLVVVLY